MLRWANKPKVDIDSKEIALSNAICVIDSASMELVEKILGNEPPQGQLELTMWSEEGVKFEVELCPHSPISYNPDNSHLVMKAVVSARESTPVVIDLADPDGYTASFFPKYLKLLLSQHAARAA